MSKKITKIVCPKCGCQYLPGELYLPKAFLGQPKNIVKDRWGQILEFDGNSMDTKETYICDKCNTKFIVKAQVQFYTETDEKTDNRNPFVLKLGNKKIVKKLELKEQ